MRSKFDLRPGAGLPVYFRTNHRPLRVLPMLVLKFQSAADNELSDHFVISSAKKKTENVGTKYG